MHRNRPWLNAALMMAPDEGGEGGNGGAPAGSSGDGAGTGGGAGSGSGGNGGGSGSGSGAGANDNNNGGSGSGSDDEWKSEGSKATVLADLTTVRAENKDLKARLKALEDKDKPEDQKQREAREARETAARNDARFRAQAKAAKEAGLSLDWVERIAGSTPEEMLADAKALKKDLDDRSSAGQRTDGAGAAGSGDAAAAAAPGVGRLDAYYASAKSNKK